MKPASTGGSAADQASGKIVTGGRYNSAMADSSSPEPQDAAAPSALTSSLDPTTACENAAGSDQAAGVAVMHAEHAAVVRRAPAPGRKPLPDAIAIHLVGVPDAAPPYDDALPATRQHHP